MVRQWVKDREATGKPLGPRRHIAVLFFGLTVVMLVALMYDQRVNLSASLDHVVEVSVPENLSENAVAGRALFAENCAACHGLNAQGTAVGPPLIHPFYAPDHHADGAFYMAVRTGVQAHHWDFGPMPAQTQIKMSRIADLVAYVRELQQANGIH